MGSTQKGMLLVLLAFTIVLLQAVHVIPRGFEGLTVVVTVILLTSGARLLPPRQRRGLNVAIDIIWSAFGLGVLGYLLGANALNDLQSWGGSAVVVWAVMAMAAVLALAGYARLVSRAHFQADQPNRPPSEPPLDTPR